MYSILTLNTFDGHLFKQLVYVIEDIEYKYLLTITYVIEINKEKYS